MSTEKASPSVVKEKTKRTFKQWLLIGGGILVLVMLLGSSIYFYIQYQTSQQLLKNPSDATQQEVNLLVKKVGKHYDLPTNDKVTVATVSDVNKLQDQTFFAKAQNGDKVLIYPKSGTAILYRLTTDKIINVGPVNTQGDTPPSSQAQATVPVKVALYNGTQTNGLTKKVEETLLTLSSIQTNVVSKENAAHDYTDSVVVDLSADEAGKKGKNQAVATQLATFAKGKVASLPSGETKPEGADILIILGQSYLGEPTPTPPITATP